MHGWIEVEKTDLDYHCKLRRFDDKKAKTKLNKYKEWSTAETGECAVCGVHTLWTRTNRQSNKQ